MAPIRGSKKNQPPPSDPQGMFAGMVVFLVENGVQTRRLQIWKQKLTQMGAIIEGRMSKKVTHVFAMNLSSLLQQLDREQLSRYKAEVLFYQWLEDSLRVGEKVPEALHFLSLASGEENSPKKSSEDNYHKITDASKPIDEEQPPHRKIKISAEDSTSEFAESKNETVKNTVCQPLSTPSGSEDSFCSQNSDVTSPSTPDSQKKIASTLDDSSSYSPPDLNRNIAEIFGKLLNVYKALGDDRRSFSYYKAIPVIEKLPFKIESVDQIKHLPSIGKSMQDHIAEIVTTGKLSKLEHFETDEKVRTISLFGEVWGIGPATALKLYEKGYRTLDDLKNEDSLTNSQKLGLRYFDDIKTRIPRHEAQEMELLLQKAGEDILPGVEILCGGSFRRGKASCGDLDIVITHPDGRSHIGFLPKYVKHLKNMKVLREDLVFRIHSEEGTDSGVDTYFGLCTYPGRELRHRIDLKVYPRDVYAFGLIAWTGNDVLNRRLRLLAESKGFRLDDKGLFPAIQGSGGKRAPNSVCFVLCHNITRPVSSTISPKGTRGSASLKFDTENQVFEFLGFPCLEPHERNL